MNTVLIGLMVLLLIAWCFGIIEKRNLYISNEDISFTQFIVNLFN